MEKIYIRHYKDPVLRENCKPVETIDDKLFDLAGKMMACMKNNRGVGLAANQVGIPIRFCVISVENGAKQMALINPVVVSLSLDDTDIFSEGCLSLPTVYIPVERAKKIVVQFKDLSGEEQVFEFTDLDARVVQHELDHLNGKLITDHMSFPNLSQGDTK